MTANLASPLAVDLAGSWSERLAANHLCHRIQALVQTYVSLPHLHERLQDLPQQFDQPQPRPWQPIAWSTIHPSQVQGMEVSIFCSVLAGSIDTEMPIRGYTQSSRQYLEHFYPEMARFVGGTVGADGTLLAPGLWEIEEKRHTPALIKVYAQLQGQKPTPVPHQARPYMPSADPREDLYRHGLHRIATEYGATCLYLWMMAHTTGALQQGLAELLVDEVNHMTKFWGFGVWAYPDVSLGKNLHVLGRAMVRKMRDRTLQGSLVHTLRRMMHVLGWEQWSLTNRLTLLYTFDQVMRVLWQWHGELTPGYLEALFGQNSFAD